MRDVGGKTIFISGGASGIGLGVARAFARAGAHVAIGDRDLAAGEEAAGRLQGLGVKALALPLEVTDRASWIAAAEAAEATLGPVCVLHSNAGVGGAPPATPDDRYIEKITPADWEWLMKINVDGHFFALQAFLPRFKARPELPAHVILTASMAGLTPQSEYVPGPYVVSKYATLGLAEHMRMELAHAPHIGLSVLCPGIVSTNIGRNSAKNAPGGPRAVTQGNDALMASGKDPDAVGAWVLKGVQEGRHYILPHPEYRDLVQRYHADIIDAFGESAQPGRDDQVPYPDWMVR
jgi:NAD(P)-dependent dehydrogenase (short-subunit alcohol dehydrogenase family)